MAVATRTAVNDPPPAREREAKARLNNALRPDPSRARLGSDRRVLLQLLPVTLAPFVAALLLALHPPRWPAAGAEWVEWLDPAAFGLVALGVVILYIWQVQRITGRFLGSRPDTPEAAMFEFYRCAQHRPARLGALACIHEKPERPRPVFHWLTAAAAPQLDSPRAIARYWHALTRGNPEVLRRVKLRALAITHPQGDLAVARCAVRVSSLRRIRARAALIPAFALAVTPFAIGSERMFQAGLPFWPVAAGALLLAPFVWWLVRWLGGAVAETRDVVLNKLLVRSGHNWRLLFAEWQADAEEDINWISQR